MFTIEPPYTERYVRWCERSANQLMVSLLLDSCLNPDMFIHNTTGDGFEMQITELFVRRRVLRFPFQRERYV
jgi:hypothetical protein